jgi:hypothetical protein
MTTGQPDLSPGESERVPENGAPPREDTDEVGDITWVALGFLVVVLIGVGISFLYTGWNSHAAAAVMWALGCLSGGFAVGFLFGIPKVLSDGNVHGEGAATDRKYRQIPNTNLTEISDWLTKIIVGFGLIQLKSIPEYINRLGRHVAASVGGNAGSSHGFALSLILFFCITGFIFGYLFTRLFLQAAFGRADLAASDVVRRALSRSEALEGGVASMQRQVDALAAGEAVASSASKPAVGVPPSAEQARSKLDELAQEYVDTRRRLPRGRERDEELSRIFTQMQALAETLPPADVLERLGSDDPGKRLTAYANVYVKPDPTMLEPLAKALTTLEDKAFGQYWAIRAVGRVLARVPDAALRNRVLKQLAAYRAKKLKPHYDRHFEVTRILKAYGEPGAD